MIAKIEYLFFSLVVIAGVQLIYFYPHLPEVMATHFGRHGVPDGWMNKGAFLWLHVGIVLFLGVLFVFSKWSKLPKSNRFISLPNKEYWFNEENRSQTTQYIGDQLRWFCFYTLLFLLVVMQLVINANLQAEAILAEDLMWYALFIYGVYIVFWTIRFYRRFLLPKK